MLIWPTRYTRERLDYGLDWSPRLAENEEITACHVEAANLMIADTYDEDGLQTVWIEGGTSGVTLVRLWIETNQNRVMEEAVQLTTA